MNIGLFKDCGNRYSINRANVYIPIKSIKFMEQETKREKKASMSRIINGITEGDRHLTPEDRKRIHDGVFKAIKEDEKKYLEINRELKLNYSKQFFVRFPRDMEKMLGLKKGKKIRFNIIVPLKEKDREPVIRLEVIDGEKRIHK